MPLTKTTTTVVVYTARPGSDLSARVHDHGKHFTLTLFGPAHEIAEVFELLDDDLQVDARAHVIRFPWFPSEVLDDVEYLIERWVEHGDPTIATALNNRAAADKRKASA